MGSWIFIPKYGKCQVDDVGGKVEGIDVRFRSHKAALKFGVRYIVIRRLR